MDLLTPNPGLMVWTTLTFFILYGVLYKFAWGPLTKALDERQKKIQESLEQADKAREQADESLQKYEEMMKEARQEAQELIDQSKQTADALRSDILKKAEADANAQLERAKKEIDLERDKAIAEIKVLAVELSMSATTKAIGKALDKKDHEKLITEALNEMGESN